MRQYLTQKNIQRGVVGLLLLGAWYAGTQHQGLPEALVETSHYTESGTDGYAEPSAARTKSLSAATFGVTQQSGELASDTEGANRKVIQTASLSLVAKNVPETVQVIATFAQKSGGFVVSSKINKQGIAPVGRISFRVPQAELDNTLSQIKQLGEVENQTVSGRDVTEEYSDIEAQLKNLKAAEEQFRTILSKATQIQDILAVQRELNTVRGQIERIEGRKKYLDQNISMSLVTVQLETDEASIPVVDDAEKWRPDVVVKQAMRSLTHGFKGLANTLITGLVMLPLLLVYGVGLWLVVKGTRYLYKKVNK